jgi:hypothetical protein
LLSDSHRFRSAAVLCCRGPSFYNFLQSFAMA